MHNNCSRYIESLHNVVNSINEAIALLIDEILVRFHCVNIYNSYTHTEITFLPARQLEVSSLTNNTQPRY